MSLTWHATAVAIQKDVIQEANSKSAYTHQLSPVSSKTKYFFVSSEFFGDALDLKFRRYLVQTRLCRFSSGLTCFKSPQTSQLNLWRELGACLKLDFDKLAADLVQYLITYRYTLDFFGTNSVRQTTTMKRWNVIPVEQVYDTFHVRSLTGTHPGRKFKIPV